MTLTERAELYRQAFPKFQPLSVVDGKRIEGLWFMGNDYRVKSGYYGGYPAGYLPRIMSMFPDVGFYPGTEIKRGLHLFSGSLSGKGEFQTCDSNPELGADFTGNAENLSEVVKNSRFHEFDLIIADPPYSESDADRYGTIMIKRNVVIQECIKVLRPGGFLVWLDQVFPLHKKIESPLVGAIYVREEFPDLEYAGEIGMIKSTNHRVRAVFIFQKI